VGEGFLATAQWPAPPAYEAPEGFAVFQELVGEIRRFRADHGLAPRHPLAVVVADPAGLAAPWWQGQLASLAAVAPEFVARPPAGEGWTRLAVGPLEAFVSVAGTADTSAERERLARAVADAEALLAGAEAKLSNPRFVERAPAAVVEKERARAAESTARLATLHAQLEDLG
jgi:valyl-tRNA synthetase